ncbi:MAG TPA: hypothetical protein VJB57_19865 [Dehalococcoidia bacterium]|nr:hypothetical protein [Dehalococcoidia bacterium]
MTNQMNMEAAREIDQRMEAGTEFDGLVPVKAKTPKSPRIVFSVSLSPAEFETISIAAGPRKMGEFLRRAALAAAAGELSLDAAEQEVTVNEIQDRVHGLVDAVRKLRLPKRAASGGVRHAPAGIFAPKAGATKAMRSSSAGKFGAQKGTARSSVVPSRRTPAGAKGESTPTKRR